MPGGILSFRAIVLTNEEWPQVLATSMKCFTSWKEDLPQRARLPPTPTTVRSTFVPGQGWATWAIPHLEPHRAGGNGGGCRKLAAKPGAGTIRGVISRE